MKTLKIEVPEGYEIDKEQSTFENIVFKEIKNELLKSWDELRSITGYAVEDRGRISVFNLADTVKQNRHVFRRLEQAEASIALAQLSQLREVYRQGWEPDYTNNHTVKYGIYFTNQGLKIGAFYECNTFLMFQSEEIAKEFLENFRELIEETKPLSS